MSRDTPNSLKKYSCLEWKVPMSGGKSEKFLLQNQECLFNICKAFTPESTAYYSLYVQSKSKIPLSFEVEVGTFIDEHGSKTGFSTISVKGTAPIISDHGTSYLIWKESEKGARNFAKGGIFSFIVTFLSVSDIELIEDANAETELKPQTSSPENQQISLKKVTCLKWIFFYSPICPYYPRYRTSPRFVINEQMCSFTLIKQTDRKKNQVQFTLAIDSDESETVIPHDFDMTILADWYTYLYTAFEGTATIDRIPHYNVWKIQQKGSCHDLHWFRFHFPSNLNINLMEEADEITSCGTSLRSLSSDLGKLFLSNDSKPDITIQCGEYTIPAHRIILATRSEVLKKKMAKSDSGVLQIKDMEALVCRKFIEYLYTASLTDLSLELALSLHEAGKKYAVDSLQSECCNFLIGYLSNKDVPRDILDDDILDSSQWACFSESQPKLVIQVLQRAYKKAKLCTMKNCKHNL